MKGWKNLGSVATIYEEEYEFSSSSSSSLSPTHSSPPTPLQSRVRKWSHAVKRKTEVVIKVRGKCFLLHKDPLRSKSTYLKRQLTDSVTEFTLSPPLNISAETFTLVADYCYGAHLVVTPFNLAALKTAAELLEMTEDDGDGNDNLVQFTDSYFRRVVAVNREYATIVFRSSLSLLPESETASFLVSKCIEVLNLTDDDDGDDGGFDLFEDVILMVHPDDFHIVAEAMHRRFNSHDVVYKIVDQYIRGHNGKMTEDQKSQICSSIDCNKLSPKLLVEAVQNPIMPLRFLVRAMLVEQLNTRHCMISTTTTTTNGRHHRRRYSDTPPQSVTTLGALLQRDAAQRQNSQLKASLEATTSRIQSLEEELNGMRKLLRDNFLDDVSREGTNRITDRESGKSASFHFGAENNNNNKACNRGAASSASFRSGGEKVVSRSPRSKNKKLSERLMSGLKKAFWVRSSDNINNNNNNNKVDHHQDNDGGKYYNEIMLL
ncbi:BTB/POZ domain-containing protein At3g49900 [Cannabis sativa]|uniref:BTB/POZ domain-containing protein At3g49900 n=1 Tax=Cannabis sativa TaxID=3483 RepID=UPI0029C9BD4A|nr:BTB/POZ domain-containing protein At3g49900 [Cannabis sativa]